MEKTMKKIVLIGLAWAVMSSIAWAGAEISGFGGYQFGGRIPTSIGEIDFKDDVTYGGAIEFPLPMKPGSSLLLWYNQQPTQIRLETGFAKSTMGDATLHYFQAGGLYNVDRGTPVVPFTMLTLGATWIDPSSSASYQGINFESVTKFSFGLGAGVKYWTSEKMAIRLQFNFMMTLINSGAYFGVGTGGANISVGGSGFAQGAILGGITFKLGS
jgi:opacity protein-like surface antigen